MTKYIIGLFYSRRIFGIVLFRTGSRLEYTFFIGLKFTPQITIVRAHELRLFMLFL